MRAAAMYSALPGGGRGGAAAAAAAVERLGSGWCALFSGEPVGCGCCGRCCRTTAGGVRAAMGENGASPAGSALGAGRRVTRGEASSLALELSYSFRLAHASLRKTSGLRRCRLSCCAVIEPPGLLGGGGGCRYGSGGP